MKKYVIKQQLTFRNYLNLPILFNLTTLLIKCSQKKLFNIEKQTQK